MPDPSTRPDVAELRRLAAEATAGRWSIELQHKGSEWTAIGEPIAVVGGEACGEEVEYVIGRTCDFGPHGVQQTAANAHFIGAACNAAIPLADALEAAERDIQDLAMLVRRLCRRVDKWRGDNNDPVVQQARAYLWRRGLRGSILRDADLSAADTLEAERWVPVAERLPGVGLAVYLVLSNGKCDLASYAGYWCDRRGHVIRPTHWRPLPQAPKE